MLFKEDILTESGLSGLCMGCLEKTKFPIFTELSIQTIQMNVSKTAFGAYWAFGAFNLNGQRIDMLPLLWNDLGHRKKSSMKSIRSVI